MSSFLFLVLIPTLLHRLYILEIAFGEFSFYHKALGLQVVDQMTWLEASKAQLRANVKNKVSQKFGRMDRC